MGKAGNAGQETSKQGCERNDGGEPGDGGSLRDYFCCSHSEREREGKKKKKKKGQTSWYQKEKEKKKISNSIF